LSSLICLLEPWNWPIGKASYTFVANPFEEEIVKILLVKGLSGILVVGLDGHAMEPHKSSFPPVWTLFLLWDHLQMAYSRLQDLFLGLVDGEEVPNWVS
jgi:hypothetical protein